LLEWQELPTRILPPQREHRLRDLRIRQPLEPIQPPPQCHIGDGLYIEYQTVHLILIYQGASVVNVFLRTAASPEKTFTIEAPRCESRHGIRLHQHRHSHHEPRLIRKRDMSFSNTQ